MRLGGPVFLKEPGSPEEWVKTLRTSGYRAAYCPVKANAGKEKIQAYAGAAAQRF